MKKNTVTLKWQEELFSESLHSKWFLKFSPLISSLKSDAEKIEPNIKCHCDFILPFLTNFYLIKVIVQSPTCITHFRGYDMTKICNLK